MATLYSPRHYGVFIGRFQPFHNGHQFIITDAIKNGLKHIRILIGSANESRTIDNPFTYLERAGSIVGSLYHILPRHITYKIVTRKGEQVPVPFPFLSQPAEFNCCIENANIIIQPLNDYKYNDTKWETECNKLIQDANPSSKAVLLGYKKDASSWYLDSFPHMLSGLQNKPYTSPIETMISATDIRSVYFDDTRAHSNEAFDVPQGVKTFLDKFETTDSYKYICAEHSEIREYKESWKNAPYPPIFVTVDAIVEVSNHILLIKRGVHPGKDKWAMPGGFLNQDETIVDGMVRELIEETGLKIPKKVLKGSIINNMVVDNPNRSKRGRTITHVFHIKLVDNERGIPLVKGGSDASHAEWWPLSKLDSKEELFEDHWDIINKMLGI